MSNNDTVINSSGRTSQGRYLSQRLEAAKYSGLANGTANDMHHRFWTGSFFFLGLSAVAKMWDPKLYRPFSAQW